MTTPAPTRTSTAINAVARETLRRIASEQISPTPDAYARVYAQIAATHPDHPNSALPATSTLDGKASAALISRLLTQLDVHHAGITITRKREGLKRALVPRLEPLDALFGRLNRLMDSWNGPNAEVGSNVSQFLGTDIMGASDEGDAERQAEMMVSERMTASQAFVPPTHLFSQSEQPLTQRDTRAAPQSPPSRPQASSSELSERVISFRLAGLLALLLKNINDLTPESALLGNQIEQIGRVLTVPLTEKKLDETERCLRALIVRQGAIKHSIEETKRAVRELAESLLERLANLVNTTDTYAVRVVDMAEQIADTNDLGKLSTLTQALVTDARLMSTSVAAERALLVESQDRIKTLEQKTVTLENELREASALVRTDPLTRAMNRRGFADAFRAEIADPDGGGLPSIALIDVDNFKRINEEHGHSVGDEVLCSVVDVLHVCAAPGNTVARYGGEEFALMFPGMSIEQTEIALLKMQRALLDHLGADHSHLPKVTFSAGVAKVGEEETLAAVITRADRALRQAKRAGKNCIVVAPAFAETSLG